MGKHWADLARTITLEQRRREHEMYRYLLVQRLMLRDDVPLVVSYGPDYGVRSGRERLGE